MTHGPTGVSRASPGGHSEIQRTYQLLICVVRPSKNGLRLLKNNNKVTVKGWQKIIKKKDDISLTPTGSELRVSEMVTENSPEVSILNRLS